MSAPPDAPRLKTVDRSTLLGHSARSRATSRRKYSATEMPRATTPARTRFTRQASNGTGSRLQRSTRRQKLLHGLRRFVTCGSPLEKFAHLRRTRKVSAFRTAKLSGFHSMDALFCYPNCHERARQALCRRSGRSCARFTRLIPRLKSWQGHGLHVCEASSPLSD